MSAELRDAVARSLRPVVPLPSPSRRALAMAPLGLVLLLAMPAFWGWRSNLVQLPAIASWGLSALQAFAGLWIVGLGLREAVPGRELSRAAVAAVIAAAAAFFIGLTLITQRLLPTTVPDGKSVSYAWECFGMATSWSLPALAAAVWLAARALPTRPGLAGALCGLGAGIMADAGVRLFCWVSTPSHVLLSHGGAIAVLSLLGAGVATVVERLKFEP